jgi:hypothetical protein
LLDVSKNEQDNLQLIIEQLKEKVEEAKSGAVQSEVAMDSHLEVLREKK